MELGILAALLGFGALAMFAGNDSDRDDEVPSEEPGPEVTPPMVRVGTDGDDVVFIQDANPVVNADLGPGDDRGYAFVTKGTFLSGGEGDDVLSGSTRSTLFGNEGNDRLGISSFNGTDEGQTSFDSAAYGGPGDDNLFADRGYTEEGTTSLFGDAGNDEITVRNEAGDVQLGGITKILSGGEGDDDFRVELIFRGAEDEADNIETNLPDETSVFITDFIPGSETLTVTAYGLGGSPTPEMQTAELLRDDAGLTTLYMTFAASGSIPASTTSVALGYAEGITLDDIILPGEGPLQDA